jgi:hypothetical protein
MIFIDIPCNVVCWLVQGYTIVKKNRIILDLSKWLGFHYCVKFSWGVFFHLFFQIFHFSRCFLICFFWIFFFQKFSVFFRNNIDPKYIICLLWWSTIVSGAVVWRNIFLKEVVHGQYWSSTVCLLCGVTIVSSFSLRWQIFKHSCYPFLCYFFFYFL